MRIYDRYLNLLTETDTYESLKFTRKFHSVGDFELTINKYLQGAEHVKKGNLIALDSSNKVGIILSREIALDENGKESENIIATGTTLCGIMDRRITVPPEGKSHDRKTSDAETVMKHYVEANFLNPADPNRKMPNFKIAPNRGRGSKVEWESRYKNVSEELEKISEESGLGWEVHADFDNKRFIFDVVESHDLTQGNPEGNQPVFFSPDFENVKSMGFTDSDLDLRNYGYVGGQGEGEERKIIELGDVQGWNRFETFVDARDVGTEDEESEEELTDEEIEQMLIKRGESKMREMKSVFSLEAEIITPITRTTFEYEHFGYRSPAQPMGGKVPKKQMITPFQYERDFNLGDKVQIFNKSWGLTLSTPIVEITEAHEGNGFSISAVFGEDRPTLISKLNRKFNDIEDIEKQEKYYEYVNKINRESGVVEKDSNDNGEYVMYRNGVLECWIKDFDIGNRVSSSFLRGTQAFPATFIDKSYVAISTISDKTEGLSNINNIYVRTKNRTDLQIASNGSYVSGDHVYVDVYVKGRWK